MGHRRFVDFLLFWGILLVSLFGTLHSRCGGKTEINGVLNGTIAIGQTPYPPNTHCEWLIKGEILIFQLSNCLNLGIECYFG